MQLVWSVFGANPVVTAATGLTSNWRCPWVPLTWWTTIQVEWMVILLMEHRVVTHHSVLDLCTVVRVSARHERVNLDARVRNHS